MARKPQPKEGFRPLVVDTVLERSRFMKDADGVFKFADYQARC